MLPKLAWSAPRDAAWIAKNTTLRCTTAGDVFLLLKTSECIAFDLTQAYRHCSSPRPEPGPPKVSVQRRGAGTGPGTGTGPRLLPQRDSLLDMDTHRAGAAAACAAQLVRDGPIEGVQMLCAPRPSHWYAAAQRRVWACVGLCGPVWACVGLRGLFLSPLSRLHASHYTARPLGAVDAASRG